MSKIQMGVFLLLSLSGCTTPSTMLVNDQGQIMRCAASGWGWIGTPQALLIHQKCVDDLKSIGYVEMVPGAPQSKRSVPIVIAGGSLDSSTVDRYNPFAVFFNDAPGIPGSGANLEGIVLSSFLATGFTVVERGQLEQIFREQQTQLQHGDDTTQAVKVGKLAGARAVVLGTISEWKQEKVNDRSLSSVTLGLKIIDAETGAILFNGQGNYAAPLRDTPQVIAQNLLVNILYQLGATIGSRGFTGFGWKLTEREGQRGAVITKVIPGTPAEQIGLKAGDELLSFNGRPSMNWKSQWQSIKECQTEPGQTVLIQIARAGEALSMNLTAVDRVQWIKDKTTAK